MDDPLSAVDAKVAAKLFQKLIRTRLRGKTRIMATNDLKFLPFVDLIVVLKDGSVAEVGSYTKLRVDGYLGESQSSMLEQNNHEVFKSSHDIRGIRFDSMSHIGTSLRKIYQTSAESVKNSQYLEIDENRVKGSVKRAVWLSYLNSAGYKLVWISYHR